LKSAPKFIPAEMKDPRDEGARRLLLGDKTGIVAVILRPFWFQYFSVLI
jgi:hypothetical protein